MEDCLGICLNLWIKASRDGDEGDLYTDFLRVLRRGIGMVVDGGEAEDGYRPECFGR